MTHWEKEVSQVRFLWLAAEPHLPNSILSFENGLPLHSFEGQDSLALACEHRADCLVVTAASLKVSSNDVVHADSELDLSALEMVLFTFNPYFSTRGSLQVMRRFERLIRRNHPGVAMWNPPSKASVAFSKLSFFQKMRQCGLDQHLPQYRELRSAELWRRAIFRDTQDYIFTPDSGSSGKNQVLLRKGPTGPVRPVSNVFKLLVRNSFWLIRHRSRFGDFARWLAIEYLDHFDEQYWCFISYRAFFFGGEPYFAYPHVSLSNWNTHTDERDVPDITTYRMILTDMEALLKSNMQVLRQVASCVGLHFFALDFLIVGGRLICLEVEIKYGPDSNYVTGHIDRFGLRKHDGALDVKVMGKPLNASAILQSLDMR